MVGSALARRLARENQVELVTRNRQELDLLDRVAVARLFASESIDEIYLAAARVGGIHANSTFPAEFIHENLTIETNLIHEAFRAGVHKLLFLGSSCIYPKFAPQPITEEALLTGTLEPTNEPYAIAKIAGIKLCESYNRQYGVDYRSVMPTNLYGPFDNFHLENGHVIPSLMRRFHEAKLSGTSKVTIWGTGRVCREFLHVDDMADACVHVLALDPEEHRAHTQPMLSHINVGTGVDCTIAELAQNIARVTGFNGEITYDQSKPDGTPRKLLSVNRLSRLGWRSRIGLQEGLAHTYDWFCANQANYRA
jgi:GDP-L-fucose synthase